MPLALSLFLCYTDYAAIAGITSRGKYETNEYLSFRKAVRPITEKGGMGRGSHGGIDSAGRRYLSGMG